MRFIDSLYNGLIVLIWFELRSAFFWYENETVRMNKWTKKKSTDSSIVQMTH